LKEVLQIIARARNGFEEKFGVPRQSREESGIETRIVFESAYRDENMLRGIEEFSHLWLIWGFSEAEGWSATVRPPRLGGNKRMGVLATRSPYRPNHLGLSSVKLLRVEDGDLIVTGADLKDGTPIYDIKPYLSFSDSHPEAENGFAEQTKDYRLRVPLLEDLIEILGQDPRPAYQEEGRVYKMDYKGYEVEFKVEGNSINVEKIARKV